VTIAPARRCGLTLGSLALSWLFLHSFVADALCVRGDEFLRAGDARTAQRYYERAVAIEPESGAALDRLSLATLEIRTEPAFASVLHRLDAYLTRHPADVQIRLDRALQLLASRNDGAAAADLRLLGRALHDARYLQAAQNAAKRAGRASRG
jgi:tetratricopeptide (TPR) repeat protein